MLHICPRLPGQAFIEPPFEEEVLSFLCFLGHNGAIKRLTDVNINKLHQPWRSFAAIINKCLTGKCSGYDSLLWNTKIQRRAMRCIILGSQSWYPVAIGATPPKPKASVQKNKSSSDTTLTPPTAVAGLRLTTSEKGKQAAKASNAKRNDGDDDEEEGDDDNDDDDEQDDDEAQDDDDQEDEGNDEDDDEEGSDDEQASDEEEFIHPSLSTHVEEETRGEESFDPILKTPKNTDDEGNGMESIFEMTSQMDVQTLTSVALLPMSAPTLTPSTIATITSTQQAPTPPTTAPTTLIQNLPNFGSLFGFDNRLKTLEANFYEFMQTNQFAGAVSSIPRTVQRYMDQQMNEAVKTSYDVAADLSEMELKKILIEKIEGNKSIHRSNEQRNLYKALVEAYEFDKIILDTYGDTVTLKRRRDDDADKDEEPSAGSDRGSKRRRERKEQESASAPKEKATRSTGKSTQGIQLWISELAKQSDSRSSFNELMDTPVDFSNFLMNRLKVDTMTPELLAGPTYELMKGSCESLVELKFFLEEVYKATTDQLDWVNPEGQQYPHNLLKPLLLIPDSRGRHAIPFNHFINNDLEYLHGGSQAASILLLSPRQRQQITGTSSGLKTWCLGQCGFKNQYATTSIPYGESSIGGANVNNSTVLLLTRSLLAMSILSVESSLSLNSRLSSGDFKRLRIQDVEDMLLLLVQGNLTNLKVEERFVFNVSLQMFTRSIVIQRRVEDLQLGVESYQKKLNLTKLDTYCSDLKRKEAYISYSNPRGVIYQNKDKHNRLIRIDELHKFSNGTLTNVCTALDDRLKGIRMKYLPQSI
nr:hypothetical protein [Tanacetum cinerariifolium]